MKAFYFLSIICVILGLISAAYAIWDFTGGAVHYMAQHCAMAIIGTVLGCTSIILFKLEQLKNKMSNK